MLLTSVKKIWTSDEGSENLEKIIENTKGIFYIGITHHHENRFGGGNFAEAGLKEDGKILIDYLSDKKIAMIWHIQAIS